MKTFWILMCLLHEWRQAVWWARRANPKLSENQSIETWTRWRHACEIMEGFHARRHHEVLEHLRQLENPGYEGLQVPPGIRDPREAH